MFVNAEHQLCHLHALKATKSRLNKANLGKSERKDIYNHFKKPVYAKSQAELEEKAYLMALGKV